MIIVNAFATKTTTGMIRNIPHTLEQLMEVYNSAINFPSSIEHFFCCLKLFPIDSKHSDISGIFMLLK